MKRILVAVLVAIPGVVAAQEEAPTQLLLACSADGSRESSREEYEWTRRPDGTHGYELKTRQ